MTTTVALGELMAAKKSSVDPRKTPDVEFELFSIPSFDAGAPEVVFGRDVGSSKQIVETGDVLLSRIVPHIRRAWVVSPSSNRPTIGSGEWIIFRSERFDPQYLRHALIGDRFHQALMQTVAGVGGSLLRGRPSYVADIEIPLPPIEEQRRIAAVLDAADVLRTKRRQALAKLDTLTQAIFIDTFGDPRELPTSTLSDHTEVITKGTTPTSVGLEFTDHGVPFVRVQDLTAGTVLIDGIKLHVSPTTNASLRRSILRPRDVLVSIAGTVGRVAVVPDDAPEMNCNQAVALVRTANDLDPVYLQAWMNTDQAQEQMRGSRVTGTISNLSLTSIRNMKLPVPTSTEQARFVQHVDDLRALTQSAVASAACLDTLFASLQQRAFRGEL